MERIKQAALQGKRVYELAMARKTNDVDAYIKGVDYIIDTVFKGDVLGDSTLKAISTYERMIGV